MLLDETKFNIFEQSNPPNELGMGNANRILGIKGPYLQERLIDRHFKTGPAKARGMRNHGRNGAVLICGWNAEYKARADLCRESKID
jgi:hypothetical protein